MRPYEALLAWWDEQAGTHARMLLTGNAASRGYSLDEYRAEMDAMRSAADGATRGAIWWSVGPLVANTDGLTDMLASEYYATPAASPALATATGDPPAPPVVVTYGDNASVISSPEGIRYWAVYRDTGTSWQLDRLIPSVDTELELGEGSWAISAIDRPGRESRGTLVQAGTSPGP